MEYLVLGQTGSLKMHAVFPTESMAQTIVRPARCGITPKRLGRWQPCLHRLDIVTCNRCQPLVGLEKLE